MVNRKIAIDILANADCPLLSVQQLKAAVIALDPIHHVQRKLLCDGSDYLVALFVLIDKFALKRGANIKLPTVTDYAIFRAVHIAVYHFAHGDFVQFNLHSGSPAFCG